MTSTTPTPVPAPVVRVRGLGMQYRGHTALRDVNMELAGNTVHGLLGRNGAGKTTLMRIMTGQEFETSGSVEVFGGHPYENSAVLDQVCFIKESLKYPENFKVKHAVQAAALMFPFWDQKLADRLLADFELPVDRRTKKLSRGQHSAVGIVLGLASRAPLTLFDEPYLGLDAVARQIFYDRLLEDFAEHPRTIVLSTHLIDEVSDLIEHVVLIDRGRVLLDEESDALRGRAVSVAGPARSVEQFAAGHAVLHEQRLGGQLRVALRERPDRPASVLGVTVEPLSLQDLIIMTTQSAAVPAATESGAVR